MGNEIEMMRGLIRNPMADKNITTQNFFYAPIIAQKHARNEEREGVEDKYPNQFYTLPEPFFKRNSTFQE